MPLLHLQQARVMTFMNNLPLHVYKYLQVYIYSWKNYMWMVDFDWLLVLTHTIYYGMKFSIL